MSDELVILSASDVPALVAAADRLLGYLARLPEVRLKDVARSFAHSSGGVTLALVADSVADLVQRLTLARARIDGGVERIRDKSGTYFCREPLLGEGRGKLAFLFPGAIAFYPDMLRELTVERRECREAFDELEEALSGNGTFRPFDFVFPPAERYRRDAEIFSSGAYAQSTVAVYAASAAFVRALRSAGVTAEGTVGIAGGELAALVLSGAALAGKPRAERVKMLSDLYRLVDQAVDHAGLPKIAMITVLLRHAGEDEKVLAAFPPGLVTPAVVLSPRRKSFAVDESFAEAALAAFAAVGIRAMRLKMDRPFNTPKCAAVVPAVRKFTDRWLRDDPTLPLYSCAKAAALPAKVRKVRGFTAESWAEPVRFGETIERMYADGYRVFLEVGPRGLLTGAVDDTLHDRDHAAVAVDSLHRPGPRQLLHALAALAANGAQVDCRGEVAGRGGVVLDLDSPLAPTQRRESELLLARTLPRLTLLAYDGSIARVANEVGPRTRGSKAAQRAAAVAAQARKQRQFEFGAVNPLVSDADVLAREPGVMIELKKTFRIKDAPFIGDEAIGTSQLSYSDHNLRGLVLLTLPTGAEIMAEAAAMLVPGRSLEALENLLLRRSLAFTDGELTLRVKAERVAAGKPGQVAVKVELRRDAEGKDFTLPVMEVTCVLAKELPQPQPIVAEPLGNPRTVHWSGREIYPHRISYGRRLRLISFVESWSESGLDYRVDVPALADSLVYTRFPLWVVNPLLLTGVTSAFTLWRDRDRFSVPFRCRRIEFHSQPKEHSTVKCYLRFTSVTPHSHLCDISVSDGNGKTVMTVSGWEENIRHLRGEYRSLILQPATAFVTEPLKAEDFGGDPSELAIVSVSDVPYPEFERDEELLLRIFAHVVLGGNERRTFRDMSGSAARRTEWLFGRIAAKEAVRRFLLDRYQARWSAADVEIFTNDAGKPGAIGEWNDQLPVRLDLAISHTSRLVVAAVAANQRVGIDVELSSRELSAEFIAGVFTPEELELAAGAVGSTPALFRFWCAKEAVSKALGVGLRYSPRELTVREYRPEAQRLKLRLNGAWLEAFPRCRGQDLEVTVRTLHDHQLAFCRLSPALVGDEG